MPTNSKTAVFDLDGTLIDSVPDIHAAANKMLASHDIAPLPLDKIRSFVGNGVAVLVQKTLNEVGMESQGPVYEQLLERFLDYYAQAPAVLTTLYPGVETCLRHLHQQGWQLGICTNKPHAPTCAILETFNIAALFSEIVGGDTLAVRKPDPAPLQHVFDKLAADTQVFVGDSEVDAATASAANCTLALYSQGYRNTPLASLHHDFAFDHFDQLAPWLNSL